MRKSQYVALKLRGIVMRERMLVNSFLQKPVLKHKCPARALILIGFVVEGIEVRCIVVPIFQKVPTGLFAE